jgi:hypothetical protein
MRETLSSFSKKLYNKNQIDSISYLYELISLQNELLSLELKLRLSGVWSFIVKERGEVSKESLDEYFFYLKNSIYRIYDILNKYALFLNTFYKYYSNGERSPGWTDLTENISRINSPKLITKIKQTSEDQNIRKILEDRRDMTHRKMVGFQEEFISTFVLPLNGETTTNKVEWVKGSFSILDGAKKELKSLIDTTFDILKIPT